MSQVSDPEEIRKNLARHVCAPVLWADSVGYCLSQNVRR